MPKEREILVQLARLWNRPGTHPGYHEQQRNKLKLLWPKLYRALEQISKEYK